MNNHNKNTVKIDGSELKRLLEWTSGKTLTELAIENGYSRNMLKEACKKGYASASVQNIAKFYGISLDEYTYKDPITENVGEQMTIDDISGIKREELKALIKEAIAETFEDLTCKTLRVQHDELRRRYIATIFINKEDTKEGE